MDTKKNHLAIIGSGATAIYLLKHMVDNLEVIGKVISHITIFEKSSKLGMGMPYSPDTTDIYNLANISSEEIPELVQSFGDWMRAQDLDVLKSLNVTEFPIDDTEVYSRVSLGYYLQNQYGLLIKKLQSANIAINALPNIKIEDIIFKGETNVVTLVDDNDKNHQVSKVVIATGHEWTHDDNPAIGYYDSPWPIHKIIPENDKLYDFVIGTLGASLSAFDVVTSLAHRHGKFIREGKKISFKKNSKSPNFKVVMHAAEGWLPHLQYEQVEPMREIYRHTNRDTILSLRDSKGFLKIEVFFNKVCRPALIEAFTLDGKEDLAHELHKESFNFRDFVQLMSVKHEYSNSFIGMRKEMVEARKSIENNIPIHWMETLDDLMYCLNFHAELLPAEDHIFFRKEVMSFLMNVIAALPLSSAEILLGLYDSGCIDLVAGTVNVLDSESHHGKTKINVKRSDGNFEILDYEMFINCSGQKTLDLEQFPFPSLVSSGTVRKARAKFEKFSDKEGFQHLIKSGHIFTQNGEPFLHTGGIDVDAAFRVINNKGIHVSEIHDITFTHTSGIRPYSYGLQACNATSGILVASWCEAILEGSEIKTDIENITELYKENDDL